MNTKILTIAIVVGSLIIGALSSIHWQNIDRNKIAELQSRIYDYKNDLDQCNRENASLAAYAKAAQGSNDTLTVVKNTAGLESETFDWSDLYVMRNTRTFKWQGKSGIHYSIIFRKGENTTPLLSIGCYCSRFDDAEIVDLVATLGVTVEQNDFMQIVVRSSVRRSRTYWENWVKSADEKLSPLIESKL